MVLFCWVDNKTRDGAAEPWIWVRTPLGEAFLAQRNGLFHILLSILQILYDDESCFSGGLPVHAAYNTNTV